MPQTEQPDPHWQLRNEDLVDSWLLSLHAKSPGTVKQYLRQVNCFETWLIKNGRPASAPGDLLRAGKQDAEAHLSAMRHDGLAPATRQARWIALRNFYGWCVREDEMDQSPMALVEKPNADPAPVEIVTPEQYRRLLKACTGRDFFDRRDAALISCLYTTGLRVFELCALRPDHIDLTQRTILVRHGKGDRHRWAKLDAEAAMLVDRYKRARGRRYPTGAPALWLNRFGRALTTSGVNQMLVRRCKIADIPPVHPHMFRHGFADRWLDNGGSEGDLQELGGWVNADVMHRYGRIRRTDRALRAYDRVMGEAS